MNETLSLSWETHQSNICSGLSLLQQRGEFVDMTLAADGHHVKVHQMVMSLVSPYIKDLISTAQCPHPVIFLNNISHPTLCSLLEYIYTGEVNIHKEKLPDLLEAGRALHIKGLRDMKDNTQDSDETQAQPNPLRSNLKDILQMRKEKKKLNIKNERRKSEAQPICEVFVHSDNDNNIDSMEIIDDDELSNSFEDQDDKFNKTKDNLPVEYKHKELGSPHGAVQYTISNQGNLQSVINRYIYNLKYVQKSLNRYWRCVDYAYKKCPASVYTNDKNEVIKRKCIHNHPFHDARILKKLRAGVIFSAFNEAENKAKDKKIDAHVEIVPYASASKTDTVTE